MADRSIVRCFLVPVRLAPAVVAAGLVVALAGCSSSGGSVDQVMSGLSGGAKAGVSDKLSHLTLISMPQIVGGSEPLQKSIIKQINDAALTHNVAIVVDPNVPCDYALHGYLLSQHDASGVKLLYVWDLLDKTGNRINRLSGETAPSTALAGRDDWSAITPAVTAEMVDKALVSVVSQKQIVAADASRTGAH